MDLKKKRDMISTLKAEVSVKGTEREKLVKELHDTYNIPLDEYSIQDILETETLKLKTLKQDLETLESDIEDGLKKYDRL